MLRKNWWLLLCTGWIWVSTAQGVVRHDAGGCTVVMADGRGELSIRLNYGNCCYLDQVRVHGRDVVAPATGVCSAVLVAGQWTTTRHGLAAPAVRVEGHEGLG